MYLWNTTVFSLPCQISASTKADVEVFILDEVFAKLPTPPFTAEEKKAVAGNVYAHVRQQAMNGELAMAA